MKLYAISDLHLHYKENRDLIETLEDHEDDWIVLGGDIGEQGTQLDYVLRILKRRFARVLWVPGNHDLWSFPEVDGGLKGISRYRLLVEICRAHDVLTPEDPYVVWPGEDSRTVLVPLFNLYDYSFRPDYVLRGQEIAWAMESGVLCNDEELLKTEPHANIPEWCADRIRYSESRLEEVARSRPHYSLVLINHFPLRYDLVRLPRIPRFSIWCGTRRTENWHIKYPVSTVVYGHLHMPGTRYIDGVRFEEVSLGYPSQRMKGRGIESYLREILPGPDRES